MNELVAYSAWVPTLLLVIFRIAGMFLTAPLLSDATIPGKVKVIVTIVVALAVTCRFARPVAMPTEWVALVLGVAREMLTGAVIGFGTSIMFLGIELAAQQVSQQMGISLAEVFNPLAEANTDVLGALLHFTALAIFLAVGGHRVMVRGLMDTFRDVPLMSFTVGDAVLDAKGAGMIVSLMTASFVLAMKVAAPVLVAMMLSSMAMGLIQRTMPQFNILSAGFQIRVMVASIVLAVSVASMVPLMEQAWSFTMVQLGRVFPGPG